MRKKYAVASIFSALLLGMLTMASPVFAMGRPNNFPVSTVEEIEQWYAASNSNDAPMLAADVSINRSLSLSETAVHKGLGAIEYVLRVTDGGVLTLDNPKLAIQGPGTVIVVEAGGQLLLERGAIYTAPKCDAVVVEKGGKISKSDSFLVDGGTIFDKNELLATPPPDEVMPPEEETLPVILTNYNVVYTHSCLVGEPPALSDYPPTEWVSYILPDNTPVQVELPVVWELGGVDFNTAGTYEVKGVFTAEVLAAYGLSNPNNISATLQLIIYKPAAIDSMAGNVLSVGSAGNCLVRLEMPPLPQGASALYIYRSADGVNWQKAAQDTFVDGNIPSSFDNFLPHAALTPTKLYVMYRYQTDYQPIWFRVEVVGSAVAGLSNAIKLEMPAGAKPGDSIHTGETGDDGGAGGNRGGGGQSEGEREVAQVSPETLPVNAKSASNSKESTEDSAAKEPASAASKANEAGSALMQDESAQAKEAISAQASSAPPFYKSTGVIITAVIAVFAVGGLVLMRKTMMNAKRKP